MAADKYYVGYTADDIVERLRKHNSNHSGFTGHHSDWQIKLIEIYKSKSEAIKRKYLKSGVGRDWILKVLKI